MGLSSRNVEKLYKVVERRGKGCPRFPTSEHFNHKKEEQIYFLLEWFVFSLIVCKNISELKIYKHIHNIVI